MSLRTPSVRRRRDAAVVAAASAALTLLSAGCASHHRGAAGAMHAVDIEVDNNLAVPTNLTVYLIEEPGDRHPLGDVPGGATKTFQYTPSSFGQTYRLLGERALARPIRSQPFTFGDEMTGTVIWTLLPNIVGFRDVPDTASPAPPASR